MKNVIVLFVRLIVIFAVFTLLFIALFQLGLFSHWILFYRGIALLFVASVLCFMIFLAVKTRLLFIKIDDVLSGIIVSACLQMCFFVVVPVTIDRSQSTFLIQILEREKRPLSKNELEELFIKQYIHERDAVGRRIDEQVRSGNFIAQDQGYILSKQAHEFLNLSRVILRTLGLSSDVIVVESKP